MKKSLLGFRVSLLLCSSLAYATPVLNESVTAGLNTSEHTALFGEGTTAQVALLDNIEMQNTTGEFSFKIGKYKVKFFEKDNSGYKSIFQIVSSNKTYVNIKTVSYSVPTN
ncbi:MAG: hypothetical protein J7J31_09470 [Helicobacteraceae bacterium]|nr:hypothetical protein [Helicobacteraceae bacterium]